MGLDIFISTDKDIKRNGISDSLSRRFVRLILGQHDDNDEEIEQIAKISGIDLTPLLEMELPDASYLQFQIDLLENEDEIQKLKQEIALTNEHFSKDIELIIDMLQKLDMTLKANPDYYSKLTLTEPDQAYIDYFKNYSVEVKPNEHGFISDSDTNFGVDIRTLLSFLKFAKAKVRQRHISVLADKYSCLHGFCKKRAGRNSIWLTDNTGAMEYILGFCAANPLSSQSPNS